MTLPRFDDAYYRRFYGRKPVHTRKQIASLGTGVFQLATWWKIPIRSVLDVGAGKGYWGDFLATSHPRVRYHSIDASEHACRAYGHELADLASWRARRSFDLVVCQSVIQYLDNRDAEAAIATLGQASRGLMYLEVPTVNDRDNALDLDGTDLEVHWRTGRWYRKRLDAGFREIGGGLWLSRSTTAVFCELELAR